VSAISLTTEKEKKHKKNNGLVVASKATTQWYGHGKEHDLQNRDFG